MKLTIEYPDDIDIDGVRSILSKWEDKGKYSSDVRRLLWSIDSALNQGAEQVSTQE